MAPTHTAHAFPFNWILYKKRESTLFVYVVNQDYLIFILIVSHFLHEYLP